MKQVTMESVKQRIADLESAGKVVGGLSLSSEFELACLRELVAVTEQRDAVVVENVKLKADQVRIFNSGYQRGHESTVEGYYVDIHQNDITTYHEDIVAEIAEAETPATSAAIAALRAEGIEQWIASRNGAWNGTTKQAEEFARQLRESKGANHE